MSEQLTHFRTEKALCFVCVGCKCLRTGFICIPFKAVSLRLVSLRLSPRCFGEPTNRDRAYRILFNENKMKWTCPYSFDDVVKILLLPRDTTVAICPSIFMYESPKKDPHFCPSASAFLRVYREMFPSKQFYDLSSNPEFRARTETSDGALMTLTTNTHIWCLGLSLFIRPQCAHLDMMLS